ncbi:DNA protecting protein DprA [Mangrovibacter plantisponsor]|uniref:DNA protecting protein DprA n=1 Tax=Mangrovibacter plantisponsor TaxID=451513 RepID=A0A317PMN8_9ENTR|nr:DNA protecting protein DprA [Mangrovibacter plantisponsor]
MSLSETEIWLRLMNVSSVYGDIAHMLFCQLRETPSCTPAILRSVGCSETQIKQFFSPTAQQVTQALNWLDIEHHHLLTIADAMYPTPLKAINDFPVALFVKGDLSVLNTPQLAIVGSRSLSWYGEHWCRQFASSLAERLTITSGLAIGIDGVAHNAALEAGGKTVAVLGNGLNTIYPPRHRSLAKDIQSNGGAIVSEFPLWITPKPANFPRRNRIISGLSYGVLVIEATLKSGSLITARCALEHGRDVFALPGPLSNPGSEGPHWLIQQGAQLVSQPGDIIDSLGETVSVLAKQALKLNNSVDHAIPPLPFPELLANVGDEVTPVDVVAERAGQPVPVTVVQLLELELAGWIAAVPGGYVRLRRACHVRRTNLSV